VSFFKLKRFFWQFSLGLGLILGLSLLGIKYNPAIAVLVSSTTQPVTLLAQSSPPSSTDNRAITGSGILTTPLVNKGPDHLVYIGLFLLLVTIINVTGLLSKKLKSALIFSSILALVLIVLLWFL
jgi:hypothetical protein